MTAGTRGQEDRDQGGGRGGFISVLFFMKTLMDLFIDPANQSILGQLSGTSLTTGSSISPPGLFCNVSSTSISSIANISIDTRDKCRFSL